MKRIPFGILALAICVLLAATAHAQTTGTIEGTVADADGVALPGVTVEASSPTLQGTKVAVTDADGKFRLVLLPPGDYRVAFTLSGFATTEQNDVKVGLGRIITLHVVMQSSFQEEVLVSGTAPAIDTRSTEIGTNVDQKFFLNTPTQRNFASIVLVAPGAQPQGDEINCPNCVSVYGSTGAENSYYIDGVNTTGVELGTQGKVLNFEFVQEAQVKTGGYQAEFGRATGGLINVITKSGGNEFHGDAFGYYDSPSTQQSLKGDVKAESRVSDRSYIVSNRNRQDYGIDLGGYLMKDTLWFFGAYDRVKDDERRLVSKNYLEYGGEDLGFPKQGDTFTQATTRDLWSAKLTYRLTENHSLVVSGFGDPSKIDGPIRGLAGNTKSFLGATETGGNDVLARYEGVLGSNWVVSAQAARHREKFIESGPGFPSTLQDVTYVNYTHPIYINTGTLAFEDGYSIAFKQRFGRDIYRADAMYFLTDVAGDHEFKWGAEREHVTVDHAAYQSRIRVYCQAGFQTDEGCPAEHIYYQHEFYISERPPGDAQDPNIGDYFLNPLVQNSKSDNLAFYLQDAWRVTGNLTLNLGIRWEQQKLYNQFGEVSAKLDKNWAPRLGLVWDWAGDGSSKLFASYGRFYETIPMDMVIRSFGGEISLLTTNGSPDPNNLACDPAYDGIDGYRRCRLVGSEITPVDPNLKGQYIDEIVVGVEREVMKNWVVGAKYLNRDLGRVIEDSLGFDQGYYIGNPGEGILRSSWDMEYLREYPVPKPKRTFTGVELDVKKRFANNWQMIASYLWSKLEGNYDGTFQAVTGQLDPNLNSAFDYADFQVHNSGYLSADRRHQFKAAGSYSFPFGLNVGLTGYYRTGTPITAMGYAVYYRNWELYLSDRGAFGRTADEWEADLHLGYPVRVGSFEINVLADVFNVFNRQGEAGRSLRYDVLQDYDVIDYDTGEIIPGITPDDTSRPPTNPSFNQPNQWQNPRSIRLGVRLTF